MRLVYADLGDTGCLSYILRQSMKFGFILEYCLK